MNDSAKKFMFDNVFKVDESGRAIEDETAPLVYSDEDISAARIEAEQVGIEIGKAQSQQDIEQQVLQLMQTIASELSKVQEGYHSAMADLRATAAKIAAAAAEKLAGELLSHQPSAEIERMLLDCMAVLPSTPRIEIKINEKLVEPMRARFIEIVREAGYSGDVVVAGDADLPLHDCRIAWLGGGAELRHDELIGEINEIVERYCRTQSDQSTNSDNPGEMPERSL